MSYHIERQQVTRHRLHTLFQKSAFEDTIADARDVLLASTVIYYADRLAKRIRDNGIYRFGNMWAEQHIPLANHQVAHLQASEETLVIHILSQVDHPTDTHAVWDRARHIINTFDITDGPSKTLIKYFQIAPSSISIPEEYAYAAASHDFFDMLEQIEQG